MSNIVIFGGSGFIGLHFIEHLLINRNFNCIYSIDIKEPVEAFRINQYKKLKNNKKIIFIKKDIKDSLIELNVKNVDLIVDFAAVHKEPGHNENEYYDTNVNGSKNICEFAKHVDCKNIIFTSSISVYGIGDHKKNENTEPNPSTPYGKSKLIAEKNYLNWQNDNPKIRFLTICRPGVVFGPGENGNVTRLIKAIKKRIFFYMGNKKLKKGGIYINELVNTIIWMNKNQVCGKFKNKELYNATFYPCPTIFGFVTSISNIIEIKNNHFELPKNLIKFLIFLSSFITKNLSTKSNYHYKRLNKLFVSNFIKPDILLKNNYKYLYNIESSLLDWKKTNNSDWD